MLRRWFTIAVTVLALAQAARAEEAPEPPIGMITPGGPHYECGRSWATPITFRELMANIDKWIGRCVRVRGIAQGYFFYADLPDYYRRKGRYSENDTAGRPGMGLYAKTRALGERLFRRRQEVEVVAMAYTCKRYWQWAERETDRKNADDRRRNPGHTGPGRLAWLSGYCHYTEDPVLFVSEFSTTGTAPALR